MVWVETAPNCHHLNALAVSGFYGGVLWIRSCPAEVAWSWLQLGFSDKWLAEVASNLHVSDKSKWESSLGKTRVTASVFVPSMGAETEIKVKSFAGLLIDLV